MDYTPDQGAAIATSGQNLQTIACADSGTTRVIAARIAHILAQKASAGIAPAAGGPAGEPEPQHPGELTAAAALRFKSIIPASLVHGEQDRRFAAALVLL